MKNDNAKNKAQLIFDNVKVRVDNMEELEIVLFWLNFLKLTWLSGDSYNAEFMKKGLKGIFLRGAECVILNPSKGTWGGCAEYLNNKLINAKQLVRMCKDYKLKKNETKRT